MGIERMSTPTPSSTTPAPSTRLSAEHYVQIPNVLLTEFAERRLQALDVLVYGVLVNHLGHNKSAWPSNRRVAGCLCVGLATVRRSISRLRACGHICRVQRSMGETAHTYFLTVVKDGKVCVIEPTTAAGGANRIEPGDAQS